MKNLALFALMAIYIVVSFSSCTDNWSMGSKTGTVTDFTRKGFISKTWEGSLFLTANGITHTSDEDRWEFSIDKDQETTAAMQQCVRTLQQAQDSGWIVKVSYHRTCFTNLFNLRGSSEYLVTDVQVINRHPLREFTASAATAAAQQEEQDRQRQAEEEDNDRRNSMLIHAAIH